MPQCKERRPPNEVVPEVSQVQKAPAAPPSPSSIVLDHSFWLLSRWLINLLLKWSLHHTLSVLSQTGFLILFNMNMRRILQTIRFRVLLSSQLTIPLLSHFSLLVFYYSEEKTGHSFTASIKNI